MPSLCSNPAESGTSLRFASLKILADENIAGDVVTDLRKQGHDVVWIRQDSPGALDPEILERSVREQRLLITFDKDFGELVWRLGKSASAGIVLFRISTPSSEITAKTIVAILESRDDWNTQFSVVDDRRIRMVPLPEKAR